MFVSSTATPKKSIKNTKQNTFKGSIRTVAVKINQHSN